MSQRLQDELQHHEQALVRAADPAALYEVQVQFLGKKGSITALKREMGKLAPEERKAFGRAFNEVKTRAEQALAARRTALVEAERAADLRRTEDLTMPAAKEPRPGTLHPITRTRHELVAIFGRMGFCVGEGPHVEDEVYNFDKLNFQPGHPARDMQDTFFVRSRDGGDLVLRTHTSPVQVRTMLTQQPPIRMIAPGTVFRRDDDATHSPMFHQLEGLFVDRGVSMADLKATLYRFVGEFFGEGLQVRLRPSYFPFVEPGAEVDMQCPFCRDEHTGESKGCGLCKGTTWIEIAGSGMVHPNVFSACGVDPEVYTGWAFGLGLDRMAMLKYAVTHLRLFFDGDVRFLEQFPC